MTTSHRLMPWVAPFRGDRGSVQRWPIEDLDVPDLFRDDIQDQLTRPRRIERDVPMTESVRSLWRRPGVEALAEVVPAAAPLDHTERRYKIGKRRLARESQRVL
jgi:hypothetical protein